MEKKHLTRNILMALAMTGLFPMGQVWAKTITEESGVLNIKLGYHEQESLTQDWEKYETVKIDKKANSISIHDTDPALWGNQSVDLSKTNFEITTDSSLVPNVDALRIRASNADIKLGDFTATVHASNSDALSIGDEGDNNTVEINNFKAEVDFGSGIRVNASKWGGADGTKAELIIHGTTDITINGNALSSNWALQKGAAIYAGYDQGGTNNDDLGIVTLEKDAKITLNAGSGAYGLWAGRNGTIKTQQDLTIIATKANSDGIAATNTDYNTATSLGENKLGSKIELGGETSSIYLDMQAEDSHSLYARGENTVIESEGNGIGNLWAKGNILSENSGEINLTMKGALENLDNAEEEVSLYLNGAAMAINSGKISLTSTYSNLIASSSIVASTGADEDEKDVVSAIYADNGTVEISGASNVISSSYENMEDGNGERTVWAQNGGTVKISGQTVITASNANSGDGNSKGIAVVAGTEDWGSGAPDSAMDDSERSHVNVNYNGASAITGDIVAGYGGNIDILGNSVSTMADGEGSETHSLTLTGNALAGNGGILNLHFGNDGHWEGRVDDYQDANLKENVSFYDPQFSHTVEASGTVNINLGNNSYWNVTGQSWATRLSGNNSTIDLRGNETGGYALHVGKLNGNNHFILNLNHDDHSISDMLYIADTAESSGVQTVEFANITGWENMEDGETLRFATVNASESELSFKSGNSTGRVYLRDRGINDMAYTIGNEHVDYVDEEKQEENESYNGTEFGEEKPGNELIEENYSKEDSLNWFLMKDSRADTISDAGKTVIAMSKVNYSNAVYMDRLNKRMGEARYIDGDDGLWVRMRHDRIGKEDAFRSMNTMFELGYDWHAKGQKDGEHRQGVAFDYMRGTADYKNVAGDGDVRRAGVWLYDTWLGDKGHYSDYVVKYGRLSNDFDIYALSKPGEKISGDYDNDVWSVSAEYGRKKDIGNDWYFEPQVQAQYAYVTSADYTTSQDTKVHLDSIDSLIGRVGFRLGRDTSEGNTVYFKADVLHEFLGGQSIRAMDSTGTLSTTYENEGTWYDVGFGFSHRMSKDKYMFLDVEKLFGNDNEDTYQVNIRRERETAPFFVPGNFRRKMPERFSSGSVRCRSAFR